MLTRLLVSQWTGFFLGLVMIACVAMAVHDDRHATNAEQLLAYGSLALLSVWGIVVFAVNNKD